MKWKTLLSEKRRGRDHPGAGERDLRSGFEKDYHRIIVSASFRRLQDKTQVFPLDKSDFIRTRLTHSLEVSSIGRSLAQNIAAAILSSGIDPEFTIAMKADVCDILQCAGLIHDIGNPPFGHFGEETIRDWFAKNLDTLLWEGRPVGEIMTGQQVADFRSFEGNAQGFRMAARLDYPVRSEGMNLTYGLLSAVIKYPVSSLGCSPASRNVSGRKNGYFASEEALFRDVQAETGTNGARNPLAFILEAADDIAYSTADIEDAFKKDFFDYATLMRELMERGAGKQYRVRLSDIYDMARLSGVSDPEEYAVRGWLREMQDELIVAATDGFLSNYARIMAGSFGGELIIGKQPAKLLGILKAIAYDYAFTSASIYRTEIAAHRILNYLLDILVPASLLLDSPNPGLMEEKYLSLIPDNYAQVCRRASEGAKERDVIYSRLLMATDTISGMTDSYAKDLYSELTGLQ